MFSEVKEKLTGNQIRYRLQGARFDEVLFADDTICISHDTKIINHNLKAIEEVGAKSGMKLNQAKCEALRFGERANMHFKDKTPVTCTFTITSSSIKINEQ